MGENIPEFNNIPQDKINALKNIVKESENIPSDNLIPFLLNAAGEANKKGITFSDAETELIINTLKLNMSPMERNKLDNIMRLAKIIHGNQNNN